jgi:uncharacterized iron-regulated membrane protein
LVLAGFLALAGLTGSLLAWLDELEALINPQLMLTNAPTPDARPLDPLALREAAQAYLAPGSRANWVPLSVEPGRSLRLVVVSSTPPGSSEVFVNPYTGEMLGVRRWGDITEGMTNLMTFIYRLHYSLALDRVGVVLMGIVALAWTLDCFIGAYLTFPPTRRDLWRRWGKAWRVRLRRGTSKLNFDLHRAGGLWVWAMLFVFAWSSAAFNLSEVYHPVMRMLFAHQDASVDRSHVPALSHPRHDPSLDMHAALDVGRRLMAEQAASRRFVVEREEWLGYDPTRALYTYIVRTSRDIRERYGGNTRLFFDADSGTFRGLFVPTGEATGDTLTTWITTLHMAAVWGLPFKIFITLMGLVVTMLSVTGVVIWWKKRAARRLLRRPKPTE